MLLDVADTLFKIKEDIAKAESMANDIDSEHFSKYNPDAACEARDPLFSSFSASRIKMQIVMDYLHKMSGMIEELEKQISHSLNEKRSVLQYEKVECSDYMRTYLKELRKKAGLTQLEVAEKLNIAESYYSMLENGTRQKDMNLSMTVQESQ